MRVLSFITIINYTFWREERYSCLSWKWLLTAGCHQRKFAGDSRLSPANFRWWQPGKSIWMVYGRAGYRSVFRYDIRIDTNWSIFDISFDTCVKHCYIWNICKIFPVMGQYCHLLYFPHYIIIYVFLKLKLTIPLRLCVFLETPQLKKTLRHSEKHEKLKMT